MVQGESPHRRASAVFIMGENEKKKTSEASSHQGVTGADRILFSQIGGIAVYYSISGEKVDYGSNLATYERGRHSISRVKKSISRVCLTEYAAARTS